MIAALALVAQGAETQQTEQAITALIVLLLVVAGLLTVLTVWYWRHTSPRRVARRGGRNVPSIDPDDPRLYQQGAGYAEPYNSGHQSGGYPVQQGFQVGGGQSGGYPAQPGGGYPAPQHGGGYYEEQAPTRVQRPVGGPQGRR